MGGVKIGVFQGFTGNSIKANKEWVDLLRVLKVFSINLMSDANIKLQCCGMRDS